MKAFLRLVSLVTLAAVLPAASFAQGASQRTAPHSAARESTPGRIAKFTQTGLVGDSNIAEDAGGRIGVNTATPTSPLTVSGVIETTGADGGVKFPDGTVQTSADISHDETLTGAGSHASPLGLAVPLYLSGQTAYDAPLLDVQGSFKADAIRATGGAAGKGAVIRGGSSGGNAIDARGGFSGSVGGGYGIIAGGGDSDSGVGGTGVSAHGGKSQTGPAGVGIYAYGGDALGCCNGTHSSAGYGGTAVYAVGGDGFGAGKRGGHGIYAYAGQGTNGAANGKAGYFEGDVHVTGVLSKGGGSFKIDHPLDPENKYLSHSFVESPDMKNIYDGVATFDGAGEAVVEMPEWFGALNRDFRYLLTALGGPMPGLYIAEELANNRFKIAGGTAGMRVSWQVTGIRQDAWANKHRIPVEEAKAEDEKGLYLHPEAFGQPASRGIGTKVAREQAPGRPAAADGARSPE